MEKGSDNDYNPLRKKIEEQDRKINSLLVRINHQGSILDDVKKSLENLKSEDPQNLTEKINYLIQNIKQAQNTVKDWNDLMLHFEKIYPGFYDQLLEINPKLSPNDLKHCAYIKMKMSKKEMAGLFGINHRSVEMAHYRIKKKLHLDANTSLSNFILNLGGQQRPQM